MLNSYVDSMGGTLGDVVSVLKKEELSSTFQSYYILPSLFNTDLDRGFSVVSYDLNEMSAKREDLQNLEEMGIDLKLDFILNHASVLSPQFQDILSKGQESKYCDFFIQWNQFWEGCGELTEEGYIQPRQELIKDMFFRKPGLPILMAQMPNGEKVPYWNTFYQEMKYPKLDPQDVMSLVGVQYTTGEVIATTVNNWVESGNKLGQLTQEQLLGYRDEIISYLEKGVRYLGQMDLNIKSPLVWEFYEETLKKLSEYGASIVRLDAFAYAPKTPGMRNFMNEPDTWDVLAKVQSIADKYGVQLLPEIHSSYGEKTYQILSEKGYAVYDFFLPGLIIDAFEEHSGEMLVKWGNEILEQQIQVVNMLGCHDGIPLLDLKGLISDERIESLIQTVVNRGGYVKNLHGQKNMYYQVNATYYSALGEDDKKMLLARAIQLFMPGKPQVWYLDLFAGKNDHEAVKRAGDGGHKEINRTNLSLNQVEDSLQKDVVKEQIQLLQFRNQCPVFSENAIIEMKSSGCELRITWKKEENSVELIANLENYEYEILENC